MNADRQIATAKRYALQMLEDGYTQPAPQKVNVLGQQALGMFLVGTDSLEKGRYASEHDKKIANKFKATIKINNLKTYFFISNNC